MSNISFMISRNLEEKKLTQITVLPDQDVVKENQSITSRIYVHKSEVFQSSMSSIIESRLFFSYSFFFFFFTKVDHKLPQNLSCVAPFKKGTRENIMSADKMMI